MPLFRYAAIVLLFLYGGYAQAAPGDTCTTTIGSMPGEEDSGGLCVAVTTPDYGIACGTGEYYNGTACALAPAAPYDSCTDLSHPGYYYNGAACVANPTSQSTACQAANGDPSSTHFFNGSSCVANNPSASTAPQSSVPAGSSSPDRHCATAPQPTPVALASMHITQTQTTQS